MPEAASGASVGRRAGIDLHAHTTASDGSLTPTELVHLAVERGLQALGVTDHDTTAGLHEAMGAAEAAGLELVPGVELNVEHAGKLHLLGYLVQPDAPALNARLQELRHMRETRNDRMIAAMQADGLPITLADVEAEAGGDVIGRPHMALAFVRKGIVRSTQEAFDRYLADGARYHFPKEKLQPAEALSLVRQAGGVPVVAHPISLKLEGDALEQALRRLKELGLGGLECYYSQFTQAQQQQFLEVARKLDLVPTGGSDFHGASKPHVHLGSVSGALPVPYAVLERLRAAV